MIKGKVLVKINALKEQKLMQMQVVVTSMKEMQTKQNSLISVSINVMEIKLALEDLSTVHNVEVMIQMIYAGKNVELQQECTMNNHAD